GRVATALERGARERIARDDLHDALRGSEVGDVAQERLRALVAGPLVIDRHAPRSTRCVRLELVRLTATRNLRRAVACEIQRTVRLRPRRPEAGVVVAHRREVGVRVGTGGGPEGGLIGRAKRRVIARWDIRRVDAAAGSELAAGEQDALAARLEQRAADA